MSEGRTTAVGLARYARDYFEAAIAADEVLGRRSGYEISAPMPVMFLMAHSIELALKAYLLHRGVCLAEIMKLGHHIDQCWQRCIRHGVADYITLTDQDAAVLDMIAKLHSSTELRYIKTGYKELPVFGPLENLGTKILDPICPLVGYR